VRLNKRLALSGKYSRRDADRLIATGAITVDGVKALPGTILKGEETILVNGEPLDEPDESVYIFHKPRGMLSSYNDARSKKDLSVFGELIGKKPGYSGRLDYDSEGLMLFTSDGLLIYKLQRKENKIEKEYRVYTDKELDETAISSFGKGILLDGLQLEPAIVEKIMTKCYRVILIEGKKRQIRRMFMSRGTKVIRLIRVRIANICLGNLPPGSFRKLTDKEIKEGLLNAFP
jgi:23S rRNA pseudouridine2605 synthase/23S rRNA pseudouridine2604 synthase